MWEVASIFRAKVIGMVKSDSNSGLDIYVLGQPKPQDGWLVSDWSAGQTSIMNWSDDNVRTSADGYVELILDRAPDGSPRLWEGGEIQNTTATRTGTWSWTAQAPDMAPGAVFGMFTYKSDWKNAPWTEFDFEFVGGDTTKVELNIHMTDTSGKHVTLAANKANKTVVDLGFNASVGVHTYEVSVSDTGATFYIDGKVVGDFTAADMPGGTWNLAPMNSYVDLWATPASMVGWAGKWGDPGRPLVAKIFDAEIRNGEYGSNYTTAADHAAETVTGLPDYNSDDAMEDGLDGAPTEIPEDGIVGDDGNNMLVGNGGKNAIFGLGGNDVLDGRSGADAMYGMTGNDTYWVDDPDDHLIENSGEGHDHVHASLSWVLASHLEALTLQDKLHIDGTGNNLDNTLIGSAGRNTLQGLNGDDVLNGKGGQDILLGGTGSDTLVGGRGTDIMFGGIDEDSDTFVFNSVKESRLGRGHDIVHDFTSGSDKLDFSQFDADKLLTGQQDLVFSGSTATSNAIWAIDAGTDLLVQADIDGDTFVDFEVLLKNIVSLSAEDLLL